MEKKIIFLELPIDMIEKIDEKNGTRSRAVFISELITKELQNNISKMNISSDVSTQINIKKREEHNEEISLVDGKGNSLGKFDINTIEGFEKLTKKIGELSNDPIVRMKAHLY